MIDPESKFIFAYTSPLVVDAYDGRQAFRSPHVCPYCHLALHEIKNPVLRRVLLLRSCTCGWWYVLEDNDHCNDGFTAAICGSLVRYDVSDRKIPIEILEAELLRRPKIIYEIHPEKLELLVGDVLRGIYDCEVAHIGRSGDGGIDLILLHSDDPIAVQVKRHSKPGAAEGVSPVRELIGATLIKGFPKAIFATTAAHFTPSAQETAKIAKTIGLLKSFDLIDVGKLLYYIRSAGAKPSWEVALDPGLPQDWRNSNGITVHYGEDHSHANIKFEDLLKGIN